MTKSDSDNHIFKSEKRAECGDRFVAAAVRSVCSVNVFTTHQRESYQIRRTNERTLKLPNAKKLLHCPLPTDLH